jgi:hypothetical protein
MITTVFDETRVLELAVARLELQRDVSMTYMNYHMLTHVTRDSMNGEISGEMMREIQISNLRHMQRQTYQQPEGLCISWL